MTWKFGGRSWTCNLLVEQVTMKQYNFRRGYTWSSERQKRQAEEKTREKEAKSTTPNRHTLV